MGPLPWLIGALCGQASAADFYVDPARGAATGDGSLNDPWRTLEEVLEAGLVQTQGWDALPWSASSVLVPQHPGAPVGPGDTLILRAGHHGRLFLQGAHVPGGIEVRVQAGEVATVSQVHLQSASGWTFSGLTVGPAASMEPLVFVENHSWQGPSFDVALSGLDVFTVDDIGGWTAADWDTRAVDGVILQGDRCSLTESVVRHVNHGVQVLGEDGVVRGNLIDRFAGDGLRAIGDRGLFEGNHVRFPYAVNDNHDDGLQMWSLGPDGTPGGGVLRGVIIRGNRFEAFDDESFPFRGNFQGIGCFDGFCDELIIENNVVHTDSWHGISLVGARDGRVVNNTVLSLDEGSEWIPTIQVVAHKDGRPSERMVVRNNLAPRFVFEDGVTEDHNVLVTDPARVFVDPSTHDLRLLPSAAEIDAGGADLAPVEDIDGVSRPQGAGFDVGAHEWAAEGPGDTAALTPQDTGHGTAPTETDTEPLDRGLADPEVPAVGAGPEGGCGCGSAGGRGPWGWLWVGLIVCRRPRATRQRRPR